MAYRATLGLAEKGLSALDGVEIMDTATNFLREHVPDGTRIHYVITNGGKAPNVVPDFAEVYYYVRHNDPKVVQSVWARVENAARGAAMATGTKVDWEITGGVYSLLPNHTLGRVMDANLRRVGGETWTAEETESPRPWPRPAGRRRRPDLGHADLGLRQRRRQGRLHRRGGRELDGAHRRDGGRDLRPRLPRP